MPLEYFHATLAESVRLPEPPKRMAIAILAIQLAIQAYAMQPSVIDISHSVPLHLSDLTGFVSAQITGVDCTNVPNSISGRVVDSCATAPSAATCPSAALVE